MTAGGVLAVLVAIAATAYVLAPLWRRDALEADGSGGVALDELRELHARHQMLLASLKDLEDDRATDKIGPEDYDHLNSRLTAQAIEVMQRLDAAEQQRQERLEAERRASRPLRYPGKLRSDGPS